ncbi:DUF1573 domain-containing protein [Planctomycetota bacterium]
MEAWIRINKMFMPITIIDHCLIVILFLGLWPLWAKWRFKPLNDHSTKSFFKRRLLALISISILLFFVSSCRKQKQLKQKSERPDMTVLEINGKVAKECEITFGRIRQNIKIKHSLIIENRTSEFVNIKGVTTPCECTASIVEKKEIAPGENTKIELTIDTADMLGDFHKPCLITLEKSEFGPIKVKLKGFVFLPKVAFEPNGINFGNILSGVEVIRLVNIVNKYGKLAEWKITDVQTSNPHIDVEYNKNRNVLICKLNTKTPIGVLDEKIIVEIVDPNGTYAIDIPVKGNIIGPLKVEPKGINLGEVHKNELIKSQFRISSIRGKTSLNIFPTDKSVGLELLRQKKGIYEYSVQIQAPNKLGIFKEKITFETNLKEQPFLYIPYIGFVLE